MAPVQLCTTTPDRLRTDLRDDVTHLKIQGWHPDREEGLLSLTDEKSKQLVHLHLVGRASGTMAALGSVLPHGMQTLIVEMLFEHDQLQAKQQDEMLLRKCTQRFLKEREALRQTHPGMSVKLDTTCIQHGAVYLK
jgi:hypothetical protein